MLESILQTTFHGFGVYSLQTGIYMVDDGTKDKTISWYVYFLEMVKPNLVTGTMVSLVL